MSKNSTVSARIDENVKAEAENILQQLGIPVSVVINTLYHQIIIHKGVSFPLTIQQGSDQIEDLTAEQLDARLQHSYEQAIARKGRPLNTVFDDLERKHA